MIRLLKYLFWKKNCIQLIHFITSKCNAKCGHCFYWKNLNKNNDLSLKEIEKITKSLPDLRYLLISGGEPFLRNDFPELIQAYYRNTPIMDVAVPTNGILTSKIKEDTIKILESCPRIKFNITLSLDGEKKLHDKVRGVKCYDKALETFYMLKELKKDYPKLQVSIVSTMMSLNQDKLKDFYKYVKTELKPDVYSISMIRSQPKDAKLTDVDIKYYKEILNLEVKHLKGRGLKGHVRNLVHKIRHKMIIEIIDKNKYQSPCYAGALTGVLSEDGKVYPCELLTKPLGNIKDYNYDFRKMWNSKQAVACRRWIKKTKCYCTHECFLRINILFNSKIMISSLIKRIIGGRI